MPISLVGLLALGHCAAFADRDLPAAAAPLPKSSLGLTDTQFGVLGGPAFVLLYALGMLASWPLARSPHRLHLIAACIAVWAAGMVIFALGPSFGVLVAGRALIGLGQAAFVPLALGLIVEGAGPHQRGRAMAVFTAGAVVGRGLALLAGGAALAALARWAPSMAQAHWRLLFLMMTVPNLILMVWLVWGGEPQQASVAPSSGVFSEILAAFRQRPGTRCAYLLASASSVLGSGGPGLSIALYKVCSFAAATGVATALLASSGWRSAAAELAL
jgi:MFS family permease